MNAKITISKITKALWKFFSGLFFYLSLFFIVLILVLQLRSVQTFLAQEVLKAISDKTNHGISLSRVNISWLDRVSFEDILILDYRKDTLIYSPSIKVNYDVLDLINREYLNVEEITSENLRLKLTKYDSVHGLNITEFLNSIKQEKSSKKSRPINVAHIELPNIRVSLRDQTKGIDTTKLDFNNLDFTLPDFIIEGFMLKADTVIGDIKHMRGRDDHSGFTISDFNTKLFLSNQSLSFDDLHFATPSSTISDSLVFFYNGLDDFSSFSDSVSFVFHFEHTKISSQDIKTITGAKQDLQDITIDGIMWGTVGDFNVEQTRFGYGDSYFMGGISCFGLPDVDQTFILADILSSHVLTSDLEPYIGEYAKNLQQMGRIDFTGSFAGFIRDFVARGDFDTDQGSIHTDINLKIPKENPSEMAYEGSLELEDVNLGAFLENEHIQNVNLKATIDGKGVRRENAVFDLKALLYESSLLGYVYDTLAADGKFFENYFEGEFYVKDPNCDVKGSAHVDLRKLQELLDVNIKVNTFNADSLKLTARDVSAKGNIQLHVDDLDIDTFTGKLLIDSGIFTLDGKTVDVDSLRFYADLNDGIRAIEFTMPGIHSLLKGEFKLSDALLDIPAMAKGYTRKLTFQHDSIQHEGSGENYKVSLDIQIEDISKYLDSLDIPVAFGGETFIEASFRQSKNSNISLYMQSDTFSVKENEFHLPTLEINGSKELGEMGNILTSFIFESNEQVISGVPDTKNFLLEGVWHEDAIDITTHISQPVTESNLRLTSKLALYADSITLKMLPSEIRLLDDDWTFNPTNKVVITPDKTTISNLEIYDSSESIALEGVYADSIPTSLVIYAEDLDMNKSSLFSEGKIGGFLNGDFEIFRKNNKEAFKFDGGFFLKKLSYNNLKIGDISGSSEWDPINKHVYTEVDVERENINTIHVEGYYYPLKNTEQLNFDVEFDKADLQMGQPFLEGISSELGGYASGSLKVTGTSRNPQVNGDCDIESGNIIVDYLNTSYAFSGSVDFDPEKINIVNFSLVDRKGSNATVSGAISHASFKNFVTEIGILANNFEFLNTTSLDNSLYYGSAYGTGTVDIKGPLNDLSITANIKTEADTRFFIPVSEGSSVAQEEYISFVSFADTSQVKVEEQSGIQGLTLDFDIEVTPDAYCELIFDIKTGDIIRGRGRGNLKLRLDTDGDFNMFGPLEITEGAYNFTVPNLLNKEFQVAAGSRITWYGDPYNATLDLDATYRQRASFEELKSPEDRDKTQLSNKIPILVVLEIDGGMLSPRIDFDLALQNQSDANQVNIPLLSQITNDEQELKRQVISLLFFKRFSPRQSFTLSGGGSFGTSVSEFLSSQVSYLASQIDENLEVEVNLADLDREAFNTFQLRFAYTFLDGRLKVTRGGNFGNHDDNNENVLNDIVGDLSVEYSLTKDARLRAKVFRKTDQRVLINENQQNQEVGISLRFVHSFNDLVELFTSRRNEVLARRREEEEKRKEAEDLTKGTSSHE